MKAIGYRGIAATVACAAIFLVLLSGVGRPGNTWFAGNAHADQLDAPDDPVEPDPWSDEEYWFDDEWFEHRTRSLWEEMRRFEEPIEWFFREGFKHIPERGPWWEETGDDFFAPDMDIEETPEMITIRMDLPGMEKSDIEVLLEDHTLIVKGKRNFLAQTDEEDEGGIKLRRRERQFGSFRRTVQLPQTIERDTIKGRYENGVLTITAPRKKGETKKPRKIEIE